MDWFIQHRSELLDVLTAVIAVMVLVEALCRGLEALARGLVWAAKLTPSKRDDQALEGAAKWLHAAADKIHTATAWLRPFSLRGSGTAAARTRDGSRCATAS